MPAQYIHLLTQLYEGQTANVRTDKLSKAYGIERGTKQGDPLSSLFFNALLEGVMRKVKPHWLNKGWGLQLGHSTSTRLTNLRFADDILLTADSQTHLRKMLHSAQRQGSADWSYTQTNPKC